MGNDDLARPAPGKANWHRLRPAAAALAAAVAATVALTGCLGVDQGRELTLVNASRRANGARALRGDDAAMAKAQAWSAHMAATGLLEHTGGGSRFDPSGLSGWCSVAENVGVDSSLPAVHANFLASPVHRANMLGDFDRVGFGVVHRGNDVWVTEIYLRSC